MNGAIGVFDSGIGGLTVLKEIIRLLPFEDTLYLGDTARVPYGTKSKETVTDYSIENSSFLIDKGLKILVVACNTASAYCLPRLKDLFSLPVVGVIDPGVKRAVIISEKKRIGIIGTEGTIRSGAYQSAIMAIDEGIEVFPMACPLFVPLAEEGWLNNNVAVSATKMYLKDFKYKCIDTLVLGCTHYPLLKGTIGKVVGDGVTLVDSAEETAKEVKRILKEEGGLAAKKEASHRFFVTDSPERFERVGRPFLGDGLKGVELITEKKSSDIRYFTTA
ncbi:MAG: glutamate racemase [Thermodesulfobacteriota bacterium]